MKKIFAVILGIAMLSVNISAGTEIMPANGSVSDVGEVIDIVHTTDMHGNAEGSDKYIGYAKIAGYIDSIRNKNKNTLVLDSGDTFEGLPYANITKGESVAPILKAIGYDAMTLGNHEFVYNTEIRNNLLKATGVPVVSANITDDDGKLLYDEYIVKQLGNVKVGVFGLTVEQTKTSVISSNVENIQFQDVEKSAEKAVKDLEEKGCDYIIALTHIGSGESENKASIKLAEDVEGIDLILDGHSHIVNNGTKYGDTLLVASGYYGNTIGHVKVEFDKNNIKDTKEEMLAVNDLTDIQNNSEVESIVKKFTEKSNEYFNKVITNTDILWDGDYALTRSQPTLLGTYIAETYREKGDADIGIVNSGGIRQSINPGDVTNKNIYAVQAFSNTISGYYVKGSDIVATFKESMDNLGNGSFLHFSGIKAEYSSADKEIKNISLSDGTPIDMNKKYKVATSSYVIQDSKFPELNSNAEYITDYGVDYEIVIDYILKYGLKPIDILIKDTDSNITTETVTEITTEDYKINFNDVESNDWFYDAVKKVCQNNLFTGVTKYEFAPNRELTRGMFIEILYRKENRPLVENKSLFEDVDSNAYFSNAVEWAGENQIVNGVADGLFAPYESVTREQAVAMLYRYAKYRNENVAMQDNLLEFSDNNDISVWAEESMKWAVENKIIVGNDGKLLPKAYITRAEMATIMCKF